MKPKKPTRTESTFTDNKQVRTNAVGLADNNKRDGSVKDISIALYDVDYAVKWQLETVIKPTVVEENSVITVPILFAGGEKWAAIQKHGYLRDNQGKLLTPLIMIKRNSVSKREDIQDLKVLETPDARITFKRKYTKQNRYDRFAIGNKNIVEEYYSIDVPKFVQLEYELLIWTNNTIQLNEVVEQLMWFDGKAFGDSYKFITHIDPPSFELVNSTGEDRIVRASMPMRTKAFILNVHGPNSPMMYKLNPAVRNIVAQETDAGAELFTSPAATPTTSTLATTPGQTTISSNTGAINSALSYINANRQLTGTVLNSTTVSFASGWEEAPTSLPSTSVSNFVFYCNGILIEKSAIVSFTQASGASTLIINSSLLGYGFELSDEVIGIGKFINQDA